jgi:catechol 2,3-dioxygenase-like lactoylglutathione lyase family enzyme
MTDFTPRRDVQAISHPNVVVDDIDVATEFYATVLGFAQATNADGPMDYPGIDLASFARDTLPRRSPHVPISSSTGSIPGAAMGDGARPPGRPGSERDRGLRPGSPTT